MLQPLFLTYAKKTRLIGELFVLVCLLWNLPYSVTVSAVL